MASFPLLMMSCYLLPLAVIMSTEKSSAEKTTKWGVKFSAKSLAVTEGANTEDLVMCELNGNFKAKQFSWYSMPEGTTNKSEKAEICANHKCDDQGISIKQETDTKSVLTFSNVQMIHRKIYICRVSDDAPQDKDDEGSRPLTNNADGECSNKDICQEAEILLRVRSPLRPLWPALGILAQGVALAIIIFGSERMSKTDNGTESMENDSFLGTKTSEKGKHVHKTNGDKSSITIEMVGEDKATTSKVGADAIKEETPLVSNDSEINNSRAAISSRGSKSTTNYGGIIRETQL